MTNNSTPSASVDLEKICVDLERTLRERRKKANEQIEISSVILEQPTADMIRDYVWEDYRHRQKEKSCSRCGQYNKYEITETINRQGYKEFEKHGYDFYDKEYEIKTTPIINKNSIDSDWGNLCQRCQLHIRGIEEYVLSPSITETEHALARLRASERTRYMYQSDDVKKAKAEINKEHREALENGTLNNNHKNRKIFPSFKSKEEKENDV